MTWKKSGIEELLSRIRSTFTFLAPMESERYSFESWLRRKLAWESIARDKSLNLTASQRKEVEKNIKEQEKEERDALRRFTASFMFLYLGTRDLLAMKSLRG